MVLRSALLSPVTLETAFVPAIRVANLKDKGDRAKRVKPAGGDTIRACAGAAAQSRETTARYPTKGSPPGQKTRGNRSGGGPYRTIRRSRRLTAKCCREKRL